MKEARFEAISVPLSLPLYEVKNQLNIPRGALISSTNIVGQAAALSVKLHSHSIALLTGLLWKVNLGLT